MRGTPEAGVDPDFTDSTTEHFTANTRDLTLKRHYTRSMRIGFNPITIRGTTNRYGFAYCGPTMNTLNRFPITIRGTANRYGYAYCGPRMHTINKYALNMMSGSGLSLIHI